jgi:hypothetical protein
MNPYRTFVSLILAIFLTIPFAYAQKEKDRSVERANWRVDNNGYWKEMAKKGLTTLNPMVEVPKARYTGSGIDALTTITEDSPDVPVTTENSTQSENSIFINPADPFNVLNSNNSTANPYPPLYGANDLYSFDGGLTWTGEIQGAGISNSGDPAVVIGNNGWYYVNHIMNGSYGQQVAYSTDQGGSWTVVVIDNGASAYVLDKNHFWIDNNLNSPHEGNLYCAWTDFGGVHNNDIALSYSSDEGLSWSTAVNVSGAVNAGSHCQGVNINTGPNGEVYVVFAIYDAKADENAYGLAKSLDGGATWLPATRIIENTRGIRSSETSKNMRVNSFPVLAVDNSNGPYSGNLYMVWCNIGVPGVNTGNDIDVYMIRSENEGDTWSDPIRVNQDDAGLGHEHYFPWITCDPVTGDLSVVFYDDRNVGGTQCEVYCANSVDAGNTWEDFKVSDVAFTPAPIPGLASGYMGDYLGISARDSYVYPCWTDNRTGTTMTYVSPYTINTLSRPYDLVATLEETTGAVDLEWQYDVASGFSYFIVYRDGNEIGQTTATNYSDQLPDYGIYQYKVTAFYDPDGESPPASAGLQWGNPHIFVTPDELVQSLQPGDTAVQTLSIINTGELDLHFELSTFIMSDKGGSKDYCSASGGCDEYIGQVQFGDINNTSSCGGYQDFTDLSTEIEAGQTIPITVTNGNTWIGDVCGIWIDWNQNEDFTDDDPITVSGGPDVFTANIIAPDDAIGGTTRMRIRIQYYGTPEPCGTTGYGEVEDYSVNVVSWLSIDTHEGTIAPGDTITAEVTFDATDMELGDYFAEFAISSDDPDAPEVIVPVTMHVTEFMVTAMADPDAVCLGEQVQLDVEVFGGLGSYAYTWTSEPAGFNSTLQNPVVSPLENTTYFVEASDGVNTGNSQVEVTVYELPVVALGPDSTICAGDTVVFDAGPGFASYEWQDGSTEQTFDAFENGTYWVIVANEFGCTDSDSADLTVMTVPAKPAMPAGPSLVDLFYGNISVYLTTALSGDVDYEWLLEPSSAGTMEQNDNEATVTWDETYMGIAYLKVVASNSCGYGQWSDSLEITVVNTTGIGNLQKDMGIGIYPNPNKGSFTIDLSSERDIVIDIFLSSPSGMVVYKELGIHVNGTFKKLLEPGNLAAGIYTLTFENQNGRVSKPIVISD